MVSYLLIKDMLRAFQQFFSSNALNLIARLPGRARTRIRKITHLFTSSLLFPSVSFLVPTEWHRSPSSLKRTLFCPTYPRNIIDHLFKLTSTHSPSNRTKILITLLFIVDP